MPDLWMDVDAAIAEAPVNIFPLIDDTDFKTREVAIAYNATGMDLVWNFITTAGAYTQTAVTPTTGGNYDWAHVGDGMYSIEIPASGGASINNDTEGFGWFTGLATGVLPWRGPVIGFRAAALNNSLIDGATVDVNVTAMAAGVVTAAAIATGAIDADAIADNAIDAATFAAGAITAAAIAADAIGASELAADAIAEIADAVWDEVLDVAHEVGGSASVLLQGAGAAADPWLTPIPGAYGAGTAGKILGDNINAPIATVDTVVDAIKAKTDNLPADPADESAVEAAITAATSPLATAANLATVAGYLDTEIAAILADTNELQTDLVNGGRLDLLIDGIKAKTDLIPAAPAATGDIPSAATIADAVWDEAATGHVDAGKAGAQVWTDIDAILVDTAEIGAAGAGLTAVPYNAAWDADIQSECADALAAYDPPTKAELDTGLDALPTAAEIKTAIEAAGGHLALILEDTGTTLPATLGAPAGASMSADIAAVKVDTAATLVDTGTTLDGKIDTIDTVVDLVEDLLRNKMEITDANGNTTLYEDDGTTPKYTVAACVTDDSTTTTRKRLA